MDVIASGKNALRDKVRFPSVEKIFLYQFRGRLVKMRSGRMKRHA